MRGVASIAADLGRSLMKMSRIKQTSNSRQLSDNNCFRMSILAEENRVSALSVAELLAEASRSVVSPSPSQEKILE
jgi:hypothetical protein